ncbi:copper chaperone PCu(A)C [uncultured Maricaulis sp.]|uniref:copper chaperone PCu(A)C n=1 Tax=uncultured Maricaulis sp. TaxID=174710 RepID=UPI0030DBFFDD
MTKFSWLLALVAGLALTACGDQTDHATSAGDGVASSAQTGAAETSAALPDDAVAPVIDVRAAWMRPHPQGRTVTAAYFAAELESGTADRLVSVRIDGAERVEMHGTSMDSQTGMMHMEAIGPQDVLAAGPMLFVPGGRHLMVFGLDPVAEGDSVAGVLVFERAGEVPVTFEVRSTPPGHPADAE